MIQVEVALNAIIFSMFFALISTELMAASAITLKYEESEKKVFKFLVPIWEITGTFFVFYAVNIEALVPSAIPLIAYTFISYILIFLILYVGRNAAIISAEFIWKNRFVKKQTLYRIYAFITYLLGILILIVYTALLSGVGINYSARTFDISRFLLFLPDDGFIIGSAILIFGLAAVFYGLRVNRYLPLLVTILGLIISGYSFTKLGDLSSPLLLVVPVILTLSLPAMWLFNKTRKISENKIVFQGLMAVSAFFLIYSIYPWLLGRTLNITSILNYSVMQTQIFYTTIIGGTILLVLSIMFFRIFSKNSVSLSEDGERGSS